ncbi:hypothetical protein RRG08_049456 [Elysia crispata]|uniref:Uncharacterized protein n=1 Tax=Elysia crispata TaxID=231223 RepID=A0AAE0ZSB2_9GAST|nr:hypothetical protein RRG08_049456 [Elysia crispata]
MEFFSNLRGHKTRQGTRVSRFPCASVASTVNDLRQARYGTGCGRHVCWSRLSIASGATLAPAAVCSRRYPSYKGRELTAAAGGIRATRGEN